MYDPNFISIYNHAIKLVVITSKSKLGNNIVTIFQTHNQIIKRILQQISEKTLRFFKKIEKKKCFKISHAQLKMSPEGNLKLHLFMYT